MDSDFPLTHMKMYKISQRMYKIEGVEEIVISSFRRHYDKYIRTKGKVWMQEQLNNNQSIKIGFMRIGEILEHVISIHGKPKSGVDLDNFPQTIDFYIVSKNDLLYGKYNAFFRYDKKKNKIMMGKVVDNIEEIVFNDSFKSTLHHEFQHLVNRLYKGNSVQKAKEVQRYNYIGSKEYYGNESELQAYSANLAREAFYSWSNLIDGVIGKWGREKLEEKIREWRELKTVNYIVRVFFYPLLRDFDQKAGGKIFLDDNIKKRYLYYGYRNIEMLLGRYLDGLELNRI